MTFRALIGCILFGTCALGFLLVSYYWSRNESVTLIRAEQGQISLLVNSAEDMRRQAQVAVRMMDLAYSQETKPGLINNSTHLLAEALVHLRELKAFITTCESRPSPLGISAECRAFSGTLDSLAQLIEKGMVAGSSEISPEELDPSILLFEERAEKLVESVRASAATLMQSAEREQKAVDLYGWVASIGFFALILAAWRAVSNGALIPLQTLTQRANDATVDGVPMQMEPTGPVEVRKLIQSVGLLVQHLGAAKKLLADQDREQLLILMDSIADGVAATDSDGGIFLWNRAAAEHTGLSRRDVIGKNLQEVLGLQQNQPSPGNARLRLGRGAPEQENFEASIALFGEGGGRVVAFRDIRRRITDERDLAHRQRLESLGLLAGGIAHDFNNYLTVILGTLVMLEDEAALSSDQRDQVQLASSSIERAEQLTKQLLTFATGGAPVRDSIPVNKLLDDAISIALSGSQIVSHVEASPGLPPAKIDPGQISQVLHNLFLNARQAMPNGGNITVRAQLLDEVRDGLQPGEWIAVTVMDDGPGMTPEVTKRIFEPFYSGRGSTGLGLAVAHSVITRHGGTFHVRSEINVGTTFDFLLPISHERVTEDAPTSPTANPTHLRFLVMDDEPDIRKMLGRMIAHLGHDFVTVNDGDAAIASYTESVEQGRPFDIGLFDLTIVGGLGGKEAASALLTEYPDARLVAVSGYSTDSVLGQYAENGFCASLAKPFSLHTLKKTIAKVSSPEL
jgi:PAS domain S-box-containing protein